MKNYKLHEITEDMIAEKDVITRELKKGVEEFPKLVMEKCRLCGALHEVRGCGPRFIVVEQKTIDRIRDAVEMDGVRSLDDVYDGALDVYYNGIQLISKDDCLFVEGM